uniref:hypothetical protein n=1 Tax=Treponema sp. TaxID=166 RepID=UPI00388F6614
HIPLKITFHLLTCKKCRTQVHYLSLAEKYASQPLHLSIKEKIENMDVEPVSMTKWIVWGIIMILLMVTFGIFLNRLNITGFSIIFNLIFGSLITVYCALFVGTNIDFFIKKIDKIQTAV